MKYHKFHRIHSVQTDIYGTSAMHHPFKIDDEEILAELFAFSATLTPLASPAF